MLIKALQILNTTKPNACRVFRFRNVFLAESGTYWEINCAVAFVKNVLVMTLVNALRTGFPLYRDFTLKRNNFHLNNYFVL